MPFQTRKTFDQLQNTQYFLWNTSAFWPCIDSNATATFKAQKDIVIIVCDINVAIEGSQMLFYVWFEFTSWLRGVGQGKGAWDCFLTIWAWDSCAFCNGKIKELDYWEIQPLLGLLDHGKVPVIN